VPYQFNLENHPLIIGVKIFQPIRKLYTQFIGVNHRLSRFYNDFG
jgi:hypothetical protein